MSSAIRITRRNAIAFRLGMNITDIEPYQPGRSKPQVYTEGCDYYVAIREGEELPGDFGKWTPIGTSHDYGIYSAKGDEE